MEVVVRNLLAHADLEVELRPGPVLVTGDHAVGKTGLGIILSGLLSHNPNPAGLSPAQMSAYIKRGTERGYASLGGVQWHVPGEITVPAGSVPERPHVLGMVDFVAAARGRELKARAKPYSALNSSHHDARAILEPAWTGRPRELEIVVTDIKKLGWDAARSTYEQARLEQKRVWQGVTNIKYSQKRGPSWRPDGWSSELEAMTETELAEIAERMRDKYRAMQVVEAVSEDRIQQAKDVLATLPALVERVNSLKEQGRVLKAELQEAGEARDAARKLHNQVRRELIKATEIGKGEYHSCPWCEKPFVMEDGKPSEYDLEKRKEAQQLASRLRGQLEKRIATEKNLQEAYNRKRSLIDAKFGEYSAAESEVKRVRAQEALAGTSSSEGNAAQRMAAQDAVAVAEKNLEMWRQWRNAQAAHEEVVRLDLKCQMLGDAGPRYVREAKFRGALGTVVKKFCALAGWRPVIVSDDYSVSINGDPILFGSQTELIRVQHAIQIAIATIFKSRFILLDGGDAYKGETFQGLVRAVERICASNPNLTVLVFRTLEEIEGWQTIRLEDRRGGWQRGSQA